MKKNIPYLSFFFSIMLVPLVNVIPTYAQVGARLSTATFAAISGYDSNIFQTGDLFYASRIATATQALDGRFAGWVYWHKNVKSYLYGTGGFTYIADYSSGNEFDWKAKAKTLWNLDRRPGHLFGETNLVFSVGQKYRKQLYTDRALGAENFIEIAGGGSQPIYLGNLLNRKSYFFQSGFDFMISKRIDLSISGMITKNDYVDISEPSMNLFLSLDNVERSVETNIKLKPISIFVFDLDYKFETKNYEHKPAKDIQGNEQLDLKRQYRTNLFQIGIHYLPPRLESALEFEYKHRKDTFEEYYTYRQLDVDINASYRLFQRVSLFTQTRFAEKQYDNLVLAGSTLRNKYFTFETEIQLLLGPATTLATSLSFDREISTYEKFTYHRNILLVRMQHDLR